MASSTSNQCDTADDESSELIIQRWLESPELKVDSVEHDLPASFLMVIPLPNGTTPTYLAGLDTLSSHNLMTRKFVMSNGLEVRDHVGPPIDSFGRQICSHGWVTVKWRVAGKPTTMYTTAFAVVDGFGVANEDFKILFSLEQIRARRLYRINQDVWSDTPKAIRIRLWHLYSEKHVDSHADIDRSLALSLVTTAVLDRLGLAYEPIQDTPVQDAKDQSNVPIGRIDLQWHQWDFCIQHAEMFYVVESDKPKILLGASAIPEDYQFVNHMSYPTFLGKQKPDERARQELANAQHDKDVAEQVRQQDEREETKKQLQKQLHATGKCPTCGKTL
ncbi:MAG: hypothetical protein Q9209_006311 [Squamulea sp. 1 TL-2023]